MVSGEEDGGAVPGDHRGAAGAAAGLGLPASSFAVDPSPRPVYRLAVHRRRLLWHSRLVLGVPHHKTLQLVQEIQIIVELHRTKRFVRMSRVVESIAEQVNLLRIQSYQRSSQALNEERTNIGSSGPNIFGAVPETSLNR